MPKEPTIFVEKLSTWVYTDLSRYPKLEDIKAHMEKLYPTTYDERRHRHVQHYRIDVSRNMYECATACTDEIRL